MTRQFARITTIIHISVELSNLEQKYTHPTENAALKSKALRAILNTY